MDTSISWGEIWPIEKITWPLEKGMNLTGMLLWRQWPVVTNGQLLEQNRRNPKKYSKMNTIKIYMTVLFAWLLAAEVKAEEDLRYGLFLTGPMVKEEVEKTSKALKSTGAECYLILPSAHRVKGDKISILAVIIYSEDIQEFIRKNPQVVWKWMGSFEGKIEPKKGDNLAKMLEFRESPDQDSSVQLVKEGGEKIFVLSPKDSSIWDKVNVGAVLKHAE